MSNAVLRLKKPQLRNHEQMLLQRDRDSRLFIKVTAFHGETGFFGGLLLADQGHDDLETIAHLIDGHPGDIEAACRASRGIAAVEVGLNKLDMMAAAAGSKVSPPDFVSMMAELLPGNPELRTGLFNVAGSRYTPQLANFLARGDREARLQAITQFLPHAGVILNSPKLTAVIDKRQELLPVLAAELCIDRKTARKAGTISRLISEYHIVEGGGTVLTRSSLLGLNQAT